MKKPDYQYHDQKIVFFDGVCVLCNRAVDFLLKKDHEKKLKFASLQSPISSAFLQKIKNHLVKEDTIIFYDKGRLYIKSTAVLKIAGYLGFPWSAFTIFLFVPRPWRDWIYDLIARNRAKWFGTREKCRVPDQETIGRIIG
jgi:predicted DCC family thiol-disulfide oxidoreductase YuxK